MSGSWDDWLKKQPRLIKAPLHVLIFIAALPVALMMLVPPFRRWIEDEEYYG